MLQLNDVVCALGSKDLPDGTRGVVVGFDTLIYGRIDHNGRVPGIYHNKWWVHVKVLGRREPVRIHATYLRLEGVDTKCEGGLVYARALPATRYYELDVVMVRGCPIPHTISSIRYNRPILYSFSPRGVIDISCCEPRGAIGLTLAQRGNVWRYCNDKELIFSCILSKIRFYKAILTSFPVEYDSNGYLWPTLDVALGGVREGLGHGVLPALYGRGHSVLRFDDEEFGELLRCELLNTEWLLKRR